MTDVTIFNNHVAHVEGGGIFNTGSGANYLSLLRVTLNKNDAASGGAVPHRGGVLVVSHCLIVANVSTNKGGGLYGLGSLSATFSTISGNLAACYGGGIAMPSGVAALVLGAASAAFVFNVNDINDDIDKDLVDSKCATPPGAWPNRSENLRCLRVGARFSP